MPHLSTSVLENIARAILAGDDLPADAIVRSLEAEIAWIGGDAINRYVFHLGQAVGMGYGPGAAAPDKLFALRRATPKQAARAFLKAIE